MIKLLDLKKQYLNIKNEIDNAIQDVLMNSQFIGGEHLIKFENNFSNFQGTKYCIGVANGTDALEIAIESFGFEKNSEIIVPANSFISSSEAISRCGHKVVFADIDPNTYTIDIDDIKNKINANTKAIIAVHLYGHPCNMTSLLEISKKHNLKIIEDCAQAHGAKYNNIQVGGIGHISAFSFYPGKNLGAYGDAGAILTNDDFLANKCKMIANHGRIDKYNHLFEGRNSRLDGLQAAILNVKLKYLESWIIRRNEIAEIYFENLADISEIVLPRFDYNIRHAYHLFVIRLAQRDELKQFLLQNNIETGIHYPIALNKLKAYDYLNTENLLYANNYDKQVISLPIGEHLTNSEVHEIIKYVRKYFNK
jgi:dTDP-4-amino-4,6-dideoxygalactose transaminase